MCAKDAYARNDAQLILTRMVSTRHVPAGFSFSTSASSHAGWVEFLAENGSVSIDTTATGQDQTTRAWGRPADRTAVRTWSQRTWRHWFAPTAAERQHERQRGERWGPTNSHSVANRRQDQLKTMTDRQREDQTLALSAPR
jgi:hypothetical protein